jgi:hypothetical protein
VALLKEKLRFDSEIANNTVLGMMTRKEYDYAAQSARSFLQKAGYKVGHPADTRHGAAIGILVYNLACCLSRAVGSKDQKAAQKMLDEGMSYAHTWLTEPILRPAVPDNKTAVAIFNYDDDLRDLRSLRTKTLQKLYAELSQDVRVNVVFTGESHFEGCLVGSTKRWRSGVGGN